MFNKNLKLFLKFSVSAFFLFWIIFKINWNDVIFYLRSISYWQLGVYVALILIGIAVSSYKWKLLAEFKGIKRGYFDYFNFYFAGNFINNFMPSFIGGDAFRAYQAGKRDSKYVEALSSVVADRTTGFISMAILALIFSLINIKSVMESNLLIFINAILATSLLFDFLIVKTRNCVFWKNITQRLPVKISRLIIEIHDYSANASILGKSLFYGSVFQFIGVALANYLLFLSLGINIRIFDYLSVIFIISLISSIPISINNIGLKEWAYMTFFGLYGLNPSAVVTVAVLSRFIQMLVSFLALPIYLKNKNKIN